MVTSQQARARRTRPHPVWSALVGLTALGVLLQGLWAGLFLRPDAGGPWYSIHQHGGEATVTLAALATIAAALWLRTRRDLLVGTALLLVLLVAFAGHALATDAAPRRRAAAGVDSGDVAHRVDPLRGPMVSDCG